MILIMVRGQNSDLVIRGKTYHIQTEDWGAANPFIVSKIFSNGAVLKTIKIAHARYAEALRMIELNQDLLIRALREQHDRVIEDLRNNKFGV